MAPIRRNPTLSDDLINEILLLLPVKSLVRFESISKTWLSLIKDPAFVKSHLLRAMTIETLIVKSYANNHFAVLDVDSRLVADLKLPYPRGESRNTCYFRLVGSANGIVCVYANFNTRPTSIYLWNPAIRQYKLIPSYSESGTIRGIGFGYDPIDHDFKVVRAGEWSGFFAEVYSANRNTWRKAGDPTNVPFEHFHVCVNGFLCGIGQDGLMAFDLNKEVLNCAIKLPFIPDEDDEDFPHVIEFNKCISVILVTRVGQSDDEIDQRFYAKINVWTLDNDACLRGGGVEASWTPVFSIDLDSPTELCTHSYFCNGDFLLLTPDHDAGIWILRNADMKEVKIVSLSVVDMAVELYMLQIYEYTESLVSLAGFRQVNSAAEDDN